MIEAFSVARIPEIIFGEGKFSELPAIMAQYGRQLLVFVGHRPLQSLPYWDRFTKMMSTAGFTWDVIQVEGEPSPDLVDDVVREYRQMGIDAVLAIGGGSVIDAAKAVAGLLPHGNSVIDHLEGVGRGIPYKGPAAPFVAVPTTAGTGSEATMNAVLSFSGPGGFKKSFRHKCLVPAVALVDPELTYSCPKDVTTACGMDALTQLIESYVSRQASRFTDALALSGIAAASDGLIPAWQADSSDFKRGRNSMAYAALISGITLAQAGLGIVHGLASLLGGHFPIPHGVACGTLLAAATEVNIRALQERVPDSPALDKYAMVGMLLSSECPNSAESALKSLVEALSDLTERFNIPRLGVYGIKESDLPEIAAQVGQKTNPVELSQTEVIEVLHKRL